MFGESIGGHSALLIFNFIKVRKLQIEYPGAVRSWTFKKKPDDLSVSRACMCQIPRFIQILQELLFSHTKQACPIAGQGFLNSGPGLLPVQRTTGLVFGDPRFKEVLFLL